MSASERYRFRSSGKAGLVEDGRACLLLNERDQWELPGGRLEQGESPEACLLREFREEVGLDAVIERLVDARAATPAPGKEVFVLVYRCRPAAAGVPVLSAGHRQAGWFSLSQMDSLVLPEGYRRSPERALARRT